VSALIGVIDYGMGNRRSVQKALEHVGARAEISSDPGTLERCDGLVLPGVGAFPAGVRELHSRGLDELIRARAAEGVPLLGICLGMQLLFEHSEEGEPTPGLGLLSGAVTWLQSAGLRLPHIGWNEVRFERGSPLTATLAAHGCPFYHVHSLAARPADPDQVIATTEYGERFATVVQSGHVFGVQFHPEKSSHDGLQMLGAFVGICAGATVPART
jgi:imidazole glycerol-phosphate synthase subunit HisH